jgi:hypothetical protein
VTRSGGKKQIALLPGQTLYMKSIRYTSQAHIQILYNTLLSVQNHKYDATFLDYVGKSEMGGSQVM